jgi:hypothetical protein
MQRDKSYSPAKRRCRTRPPLPQKSHPLPAPSINIDSACGIVGCRPRSSRPIIFEGLRCLDHRKQIALPRFNRVEPVPNIKRKSLGVGGE